MIKCLEGELEDTRETARFSFSYVLLAQTFHKSVSWSSSIFSLEKEGMPLAHTCFTLLSFMCRLI